MSLIPVRPCLLMIANLLTILGTGSEAEQASTAATSQTLWDSLNTALLMFVASIQLSYIFFEILTFYLFRILLAGFIEVI